LLEFKLVIYRKIRTNKLKTKLLPAMLRRKKGKQNELNLEKSDEGMIIRALLSCIQQILASIYPACRT
jgi:hypothetical protein